MRCLSKLPLFVLPLALAVLAVPARADDLAPKGRDIFKQHQQAVVTVQTVLKLSRGGRSSENRQELTGTVVDPSGLTVLALSACDPSEMYQRMTAGESSQDKLETEVTDIKILLADGAELPAEMVLRDKDLDLAFLRPDPAPAQPLTAVDLTASAKTDILEETLVLQRLGEVANRVPGAVLDQVEGVIQKPRLMYVPGLNGQSCSLGAPVFTLDGKVIGILVNRFPAAGGGREERGPMTVLLPAEDVLEVAKQAPAPAAK